jgi:GT2 family glycosyltransferase
MNFQDIDSANVSVVMLTMNQGEKTLRALASFREITSPPFHLLLWDNGSSRL